jgi:hypothetical protein
MDILSLLWELKHPSKYVTKERGWVDLGVLARSKGLIPHHSVSFPRLTEEVIGRTFNSSEDVRCSNWCQRYLSDGQKDYAVKNAWLALHLYKAIVDRPPAGARLSQVGLAGDKITLRNGDVAVAHGIFAEQPTKFPVSPSDPNTAYINISRTKRAVVTIQKILAPAFISHYLQRSLEDLGPVPFDIVVDLASLVSRELDSDSVAVHSGIDPSSSTMLISAVSGGRVNEADDLRAMDSDSQDSDSSDSDSDSDSESDDEPLSPATSTASALPPPVAEDDLEHYMDADIDAYIATHQGGPSESPSGASHHPLVQPEKAAGPRPTRVFQDVFHEMQRINRHISKDHSLAKQFSRFLRDALLLPDKIDKARVEAVLKKDGKTWDQAVRSKPDWVWDRVRRYLPPPDSLEPVLKKLFDTHRDLKCSRRNIRLFDDDTRKAAAAMIEDVRKGWVSDPAGYALYNRLRTDKNGLDIWHCIRGTSGLEGSVHMPVRSRFGSLGASIELTVALLSDFCYRRNLEVRHYTGLFFSFTHRYRDSRGLAIEMGSNTMATTISGSRTTSTSPISRSHLTNHVQPAQAISTCHSSNPRTSLSSYPNSPQSSETSTICFSTLPRHRLMLMMFLASHL